MKKTVKLVLGSVLFLIALGYLAFIWGRLPGHFNPNQLSGKGPITGYEFSCGWNWRSPMLYACEEEQFFHDSLRVYFGVVLFVPLVAVFGIFLSPFWLLFDHFLWPFALFVLTTEVFVGYLLYRWYKRKHPPVNPRS